MEDEVDEQYIRKNDREDEGEDQNSDSKLDLK